MLTISSQKVASTVALCFYSLLQMFLVQYNKKLTKQSTHRNYCKGNLSSEFIKKLTCNRFHFVKTDVVSDNTIISKSDKDEFKCSANSTQQCSYTWYSDETIVSTSENWKPTRSGQYLCKAKCDIRGQTCLVTARNLNVSVESTTGGMV